MYDEDLDVRLSEEVAARLNRIKELCGGLNYAGKKCVDNLCGEISDMVARYVKRHAGLEDDLK